MEQLLRPECQGPLLLSAQIRGDLFGGRAEGRGLMPVTQITEISLTWDHKSSFFHSKVVSVRGLCPWTPLGDFCPPHPLDLLPRKDLLATPLGLAGMRSAWHNPAWVATVQLNVFDNCFWSFFSVQQLVRYQVYGNVQCLSFH